METLTPLPTKYGRKYNYTMSWRLFRDISKQPYSDIEHKKDDLWETNQKNQVICFDYNGHANIRFMSEQEYQHYKKDLKAYEKRKEIELHKKMLVYFTAKYQYNSKWSDILFNLKKQIEKMEKE